MQSACFTFPLKQAPGDDEDGEGLRLLAALLTVELEAGQLGVLVHIRAVRAALSHERDNRYRPRLVVALVLTTCVKRKRVTEIIVETVALRTVVDVAVKQDTMGLVANEVSLGLNSRSITINYYNFTKYTESKDLLMLIQWLILSVVFRSSPASVITSQSLLRSYANAKHCYNDCTHNVYGYSHFDSAKSQHVKNFCFPCWGIKPRYDRGNC